MAGPYPYPNCLRPIYSLSRAWFVHNEHTVQQQHTDRSVAGLVWLNLEALAHGSRSAEYTQTINLQCLIVYVFFFVFVFFFIHISFMYFNLRRHNRLFIKRVKFCIQAEWCLMLNCTFLSFVMYFFLMKKKCWLRRTLMCPPTYVIFEKC